MDLKGESYVMDLFDESFDELLDESSYVMDLLDESSYVMDLLDESLDELLDELLDESLD